MLGSPKGGGALRAEFDEIMRGGRREKIVLVRGVIGGGGGAGLGLVFVREEGRGECRFLSGARGGEREVMRWWAVVI